MADYLISILIASSVKASTPTPLSNIELVNTLKVNTILNTPPHHNLTLNVSWS